MWYGQINRTIWEITQQLQKNPKSFRLRKELLRTHFLQRYEYDRSHHIPRDDRSFLFLQEGSASVCLLLHGGMGTPAEMRELGGFLFSRGYSVYCPRLPRFDMKGRIMSWESWMTEAEQAFLTVREYSKQTHLIGLSLGATIAFLLTAIYKTSSSVMLAPALYPRYSLKERFYAVGRKVFPSVFFHLAGWEGLKAMETARRNPQRIESPALVLQARDDTRLSTKGLKWARSSLVHDKSEVVLLPHGSHTLTRGIDKQEVFQRICGFIQKF
jgi:carboxylesterase